MSREATLFALLLLLQIKRISLGEYTRQECFGPNPFFVGDHSTRGSPLTLKLVSFCAAFFVASCTSSGLSVLDSSAFMLLNVRRTWA